MNTIQSIKLAAIAPSRTNPRKHFDEAALAELTGSIKEHGVLQPVLVRPVKYELDGSLSFEWRLVKHIDDKPGNDRTVDSWPKKKKEVADAGFAKVAGITHELVAGERRWKAATAAGLTEIPAIVRTLDDKAALEVQVIENLQRADLHPIEEAEGYEALMKAHNYTAEDIAAKVGKSKAYVYGRLKLTSLCKEARKAMWDGKLSASVALLLARMPSQEMQAEALKEICVDFDGEPVSYRVVCQEIQRHYMLRLKDAPFNTKDPNLVHGCGPCFQCPKRTGNQKELFADVDSADVCTDPACFAKKKEAHNQQLIEKAEAKGKKVIREYDRFDRQYVDLKASECLPTGKGIEEYQPWKKHLGKDCPETMLAVDKDGEVHEVVKRSDAMAVLKEAGKISATSNGNGVRKAEVLEQRIDTLTNWKITGAILEAFGCLPAMPKAYATWWRSFALGAFDFTNIEVHSQTAKRRGIAEKTTQAREALENWIKSPERTQEQLASVTLEMLCCANPWREERWVELCRAVGIDQIQFRKEAEAELKQPKKGKESK